jgi:hypothetical protein
MKKWSVGIYYQASKVVVVRAHTREEAKRIAEEDVERMVKGIEEGSAEACTVDRVDQ